MNFRSCYNTGQVKKTTILKKYTEISSVLKAVMMLSTHRHKHHPKYFIAKWKLSNKNQYFLFLHLITEDTILSAGFLNI